MVSYGIVFIVMLTLLNCQGETRVNFSHPAVPARTAPGQEARMKRFPALTIITVTLAAAGIGCAGPPPPASEPAAPPPVVSHGGPVTDYVSLFDNLRAAGASVVPAGEILQPFFSVTGNAISVDGGNVQVFEYADSEEAEAQAALVSPEGSPIGTTMVSWIAPPHFYRAGKIIVLYVGDDAGLINRLESVLGTQFAGG